jgi:hypothetical protein
MKKLLYLILTAIFAITLSSYTTDKKVATGDSVLVKTSINVNMPRYQKGDDALITKATEVMQELVSQGDSRLLLMQDALSSSSTRIEEVCIFLNISGDELFKKARADTLIRFITSLLIALLLISGVYYLFSYSRNSMNWQGTIVITIVFILTIILLQNHLYDILSYCFNRDYQNILNFTKLIN